MILKKYQKGKTLTVKSEDGTITNRIAMPNGNTKLQVKTPDGNYFEKIIDNKELNNALAVLENSIKPEFKALGKVKADEKRNEKNFLNKTWENYKSWPTADKVSDRIGAFMNDPFGMTSRAILGEQAYIPGMGEGLHDFENPEIRNRYLNALGYTPGTFDASDLQNMINPFYAATSIEENYRKGNTKTATAETALALIPFLPKGSFNKNTWKQGARMLADDYNKIKLKNKLSNFKSEIDWSKWNKEIPENKKLMREYHAIEQQAKADGTWMKNPDGSKFNGTPEQFVQQNSENFKKAFPNVLRDKTGNIQKTYHGSQDKFESFDPNIMRVGRTRGQGIYTSPIKERAATYANKGEKQLYEFYQNANKKQTIIEDFNNLSQKRLDEFLRENPKESKNFDEKFKTFMEKEDMIFNRDITDDSFKLNEGYDFYKASPDEYVVPFTNYPISAIGNNGMFDMTNPNIYKVLAPITLGSILYNKNK
jgi:hypothetical protein